MLYNNVAAAAAAAAAKPFNLHDPSHYPLSAAAAAFGAFNRQPLYNPAALYSQELAHHFASWWPAAAAGAAAFYNPHNTSAFPFNPFAAAANYSAQQQAAAAVFHLHSFCHHRPSQPRRHRVARLQLIHYRILPHHLRLLLRLIRPTITTTITRTETTTICLHSTVHRFKGLITMELCLYRIMVMETINQMDKMVLIIVVATMVT